jgi:hypothetical protein
LQRREHSLESRFDIDLSMAERADMVRSDVMNSEL